MNPKEFMRRWIEGIKNLSQTQQLYSKLWLFAGGAFGLALATITLIMRKSWGLSIFVFCMVGLQIISFIGTRQQYIAMKGIEDELKLNEKAKEEDLAKAKIDNMLGNTR